MGSYLFLFLFLASLTGQPSADQEARIRRLERRLLAPCCYSESVADHRSEVAVQMRQEIRQMVREGRSDQEILDYYKSRYGVRVLAEPEGELWWVMNVVPVVALAVGLVIVLMVVRRWYKRTAAGAAST